MKRRLTELVEGQGYSSPTYFEMEMQPQMHALVGMANSILEQISKEKSNSESELFARHALDACMDLARHMNWCKT